MVLMTFIFDDMEIKEGANKTHLGRFFKNIGLYHRFKHRKFLKIKSKNKVDTISHLVPSWRRPNGYVARIPYRFPTFKIIKTIIIRKPVTKVLGFFLDEHIIWKHRFNCTESKILKFYVYYIKHELYSNPKMYKANLLCISSSILKLWKYSVGKY